MRKDIHKDLIVEIRAVQRKLQLKESRKNGVKKKRITFAVASRVVARKLRNGR